MEKLHYNITIAGLVQGVWFRKYTKDKAVELKIKGFVKNNKDSKVYLEAEGDSLMLGVFLEWLKVGSPMSIVSSVDYTVGVIKNFKYFEIKS
ncbi:MAG: acylphosphatase [Bacteroidetes bacterium]|nr:MAG: acylphosphatase [Bacteroidota bacterium]